MIVVMMGVTGSGKTTIGELLANKIAAAFADADDYHSVANKEKMAAGRPLDDDDRQPWLETLNGLLRSWFDTRSNGVLACSALKQKYRDTLASGIPVGTLHFVWLDGSPDLLAGRLAARHHEYMNPNLLKSQFDTLEAPADALRIVNDRSPDEVVDRILQQLPSGERSKSQEKER